MIYFFALLQFWRELDFQTPDVDDPDAIRWSGPAAAAILVLLTILLMKARRNYKALPLIAKMPDSSPTPDVSVVIPARNESRTIVPCISSFPGVPVIVVDDDSTDQTGEVARKAGAKVVESTAVHPGTAGKPNALVAGAAGANSEYLLFADADTRYERAFLSSMVQHAKRNECVLLTPLLRQDCGGLLAKMIVPFGFALSFTGISAKRVNQTLRGDVVANGACMMFRREPYEFFGGHRPVIHSTLDDVEIARVVKRHRMRMQLARAEHLGSVWHGRRPGVVWSEIQRTWFPTLRARGKGTWQAILSLLLFLSIAPVAAWLVAERQWVYLAVFLIWPVVILKPWCRGWLGPLLYLPAIYIFGAAALHSMISAWIGLESDWKGRGV